MSLREAFEGWTEDRWYKGSFENPLDRRQKCIVGQGISGRIDLLDEAAEELFPNRARRGGFHRPVAEFNDHPDTTFADVLRVVDRAIEIEETS